MSYLKVLRWSGGEGGDALLACALLSNPHIKSNMKIETLNLNLQGRTMMQVDENFKFFNLKEMALTPEVDKNLVISELENLKLLEENHLLKSHMPYSNMPYTVGIYPGAKTLRFFFKAKLTKLAYYYAKNNPDLFHRFKNNKEKVIDLGIQQYQEIFEKISIIKQELIIDDLILKNYDKMQNVLELNFNSTGIEYFEKWVEKQKELYWNELKILFE